MHNVIRQSYWFCNEVNLHIEAYWAPKEPNNLIATRETRPRSPPTHESPVKKTDPTSPNGPHTMSLAILPLNTLPTTTPITPPSILSFSFS